MAQRPAAARPPGAFRRFCFEFRAVAVRFGAWPGPGALRAGLAVRAGFLELDFAVRFAPSDALVDAAFLAGEIDRRGDDAFFVRDAREGDLDLVDRAAFARVADFFAFFAAGFFAARPAAALATCFTFRLTGFSGTGRAAGATPSGGGASCAGVP